jgi:hypothetical protein
MITYKVPSYTVKLSKCHFIHESIPLSTGI